MKAAANDQFYLVVLFAKTIFFHMFPTREFFKIKGFHNANCTQQSNLVTHLEKSCVRLSTRVM